MLLKNVIKKEFNEGFFECVIMTSWVTLLLRHFIRVRDNAWNPRVFVETGGRGKRLKPTGGENLYRQIHAASTRRAKSTRLAWKSRQIGGLVLLMQSTSPGESASLFTNK